MLEDLSSIKQAVATYAAICAADLHKQSSFATSLYVYLRTNRHRSDMPQYNPSREIKLPYSSNTTHTLVKHALQLVDEMYIPGFSYKKGGVIIPRITTTSQPTLFDDLITENCHKLISPIEDHYSHGFNRALLSYAVMGYGQRDHIDMKDGHPSPCFSTNFNEIIRINCNE